MTFPREPGLTRIHAAATAPSAIAPLLVKLIFEKIVELNRTRKLTILLVEQNANLALEISHRGYVLETGRILLSDNAAALRADPKVREAYLGG